MKRIALIVPLVLGLFVVAGCSSDGGPTGPDTVRISGTWTGSAAGGTFTFTLSESSNGAITGSGSAAGPSGTIALSVLSGTHAGSSVSFTFGGTGFEDANFSGTLSGADALSGAVNGSGFNNFALTLRRQ